MISSPDSAPSPDAAAGRQGRLLQVLGVGFGIAVAIGNTIGAGIFRAPGEVAAHLPDPTLFLAAWAAGGVYALLGAMQIAELATMLPRSGGQYIFSRYALGEYAGFVVGWSDWISTCGSTATVAIVVAEFGAGLLPGAAGWQPAIAIAVTMTFAAAQWRGIHEGSLVQNVTSAIKAIVFAALVAAAFAVGGAASANGAAPAATLPVTMLAVTSAFVLALQSVIYTYDGWTGVIYFSEEVRDPDRDIPRALFGGVLAVIAIYLLLNAALLHALPMATLAGEPFAAATVARAFLGDGGETVIRLLTIASLLSAVNALHLIASRVLLAMTRDGLFFRRAAVINAGGTPTVSLFLSAAVAVLFIVFGRTFARVITILSFFFIANYTLSFVSLMVLRRREPHRRRPFRVWAYPWSTLLALAGSAAFLGGAVASDPANSIGALALLAASYPVFRLLKRWA